MSNDLMSKFVFRNWILEIRNYLGQLVQLEIRIIIKCKNINSKK